MNLSDAVAQKEALQDSPPCPGEGAHDSSPCPGGGAGGGHPSAETPGYARQTVSELGCRSQTRTISDDPLSALPLDRGRSQWAALIFGTAIAIGAFLGQPAYAHGGEDHSPSEPTKPAATLQATDKAVVRAASSESFELVLKLDAAETSSEQHVHLYLADFTSNEPVVGAQLALDWGDGLTGAVKATADPGIYEATVRFPKAGSYSPLVTLTANGRDDLLTLDPIPVVAPTGAPKPTGTVLVTFSLAAVGALFALVLWHKRQQTSGDAPREVTP